MFDDPYGSANPALQPPDNWLIRASRGLDELIGRTGIPSFTGDIGAGIGGMFGLEAQGRQIGQQLPRDILNIAPAFAGPIGFAPAAALSGASGYERSGGNVAAGVISGAMAPLMPLVGRAGGQLALRALGAPAVTAAGDLGAATVGQRVGEITAENLAALGLGEAAGQATSIAQGQGPYDPFTKEHLFQTVAGTVPFAAMSLPHMFSPLARPSVAPPPMMGEQMANIRKTVAGQAQQQPASRVSFDDTGNITVVGTDGKPTTFPNLAEADRAMQLEDKGIPATAAAATTFSLPDDPLAKLDEVKVDTDSISKMEKLMAVGVGLGGKQLTLENLHAVARNYILPEEQAKMSSGLSPSESVARSINDLHQRAEKAVKQIKDFEEPLEEFKRQTGITGDVNPVVIATMLKPEYAQVASEVIQKHELTPISNVGEIEAANKRITSLMAQQDDPEVQAALQQEVERNLRQIRQMSGEPDIRVDTGYDPELSTVLEGRIPDEELASIRGGIRMGEAMSDVTPYIYARVYKLQQEGVPAADVRIKKDYILRDARREGWDMEMVPNSKFATKAEAAQLAGELDTTADKGVRYKVQQSSTLDPKTGLPTNFYVMKFTNNFRALIENKDIAQMVPNQEMLAAEAKMLDVDPMELQDARELQEMVAQASRKSGVTAGAEHYIDLLTARRRWMVDQMKPADFRHLGVLKTKQPLMAQQARVLVDLMLQPELQGHLPSVTYPRKPNGEVYKTEDGTAAFELGHVSNVDRVVKFMEDAGVPFEYSPENKVKDVNAALGRLYNILLPRFQTDPVLQRIQGALLNMTGAIGEGPTGGVTPEYKLTTSLVRDFVAKAKNLGKQTDVSVVESDAGLRRMLRDRYGKKEGDQKFDSYLRETSSAAEGWYDSDAKQIVLMPANIRQRADELTYEQAVNRVLWHEGAGHFGLQAILGNEYPATLRRMLGAIPAEDRRTIAELYTGGNQNHPLVSAEYMARMAEKDPQLSTVQEFYGNLRRMAAAVGRPMEMSGLDMKILARRSRDYLFQEAGILRGNTSWQNFQDQSLGTEPHPTSPDYSLASRYLSPSDKMGLPSAFDVMEAAGRRKGLDAEEAVNQANRGVRTLQSGDAIDQFRWAAKAFNADSPIEGHYMTIKASRSPRENMSKMIEAKTLHDGFARSLTGEFNPNSPVLARRDEIVAWAAKTPLDVKESTLRGLSKIAGTELGLPEAIERSQAATEFPNSIAALAANAITAKGAQGFEEIARYAPKPVAEMVRALVKENIEDARSALGVRQAEEMGITQGRLVSADQKKGLENILGLQSSARKVDAESARIGRVANKMSQFDPENFDLYSGLLLSPTTPRPTFEQLSNTMYSLGGWKPVPTEFPKKPNILQRQFELASNLAETYPEFYPFYKTARGYPAAANSAANKIFQNFGFTIAGGRITRTPAADIFKQVAVREDLRGALDVLRLRQNEKVDDPARTGSGRLTPAELNSVRATDLPGISDPDFQKVTALLEQSANATKETAEVILRSKANRIAHVMKMYLGKKTNFQNMQGTKEFEQAMAQHIYAGTPIDYARFGAMLGPTNVSEAATFVLSSPMPGTPALIDTYNTMAQHYRGRDGYLPEIRVGEYKVQYVRTSDGAVATLGARTPEEVKKMEAQLYAAGDAAPGTVRYQRSTDIRAEDLGLGKSALERAADIEEAAMESNLRASMGDAAYDATVAPFYEPLKAAQQAELTKTMGDYMKNRGLKAGREQLDTLDTLMSYIPSVVWGASRSYVKQDASFYMNDQRLANNPVLRDVAKQEIDNALRVASGGEKAVKELAFQYFMALNPSTMVFELTQSLSTLAPWLTRHGAGFAGAYRELMRSYSTIGQARISGRYSDPQLEAFSKRAVEEGVLDKGLWQEYEDPHRDMRDALTEVSATRKKVRTAIDLGKSYLQMTRNLYGSAAYLNNRIGFVAGYERGKAMGLTGEQLYDFAGRTVGATMFSGGRANRSIGLYSSEGPVGGTLAATFGSLQSYFFGMVGTMARSIKEAYRETRGSTISPHDGWAARKSMVQLFGTQLFLAGALGMPGMQAALAVLEQIFPEAELKKAVREMPAKLLGDSEFSRMIGDSMLFGAPTATLPIDVSGRIGLSSILGVSNLDGFSPAQLAGPAGSIVQNLYKASQSAQGGNWLLAAEQAAPAQVKNIIKAVKDDGVVRDYSGNAVLQLSGPERVLQSLGFRPKEVSQFQEAQSLEKRTEAVAQHRERALTQDLAQRMISGDSAGVVQQLSERRSTEPSYDIRTAAKRAARKATDMTLPTELGRGGTLRSATDIGNMLRGLGEIQQPQASEMNRLMSQSAFLGRLGVPGLGVPQRQEIQTAATIDALRASNPALTADEARRQLAERSASRHPMLLPSFAP